MSERRLMPVQVDVIKEVLVDRILQEVLDREPAEPVTPVQHALAASLDLPGCDSGVLDLRMRGIGYLTRVVEADMFDPAREAMEGLAGALGERLAAGKAWAAAATEVARELAAGEPLPKPSPADEGAVSWKVPGPGGHVRHFVVAAAIAELLSGGQEGPRSEPVAAEISDPGQLKRSWTYGFLIRCCEEALPP